MTDEFFIDGKRYTTKGKSPAQLEHMLQLAKDAVERYKVTCRNYPATRMERVGTPFMARLQAVVETIEKAIREQ